MHISSLMCMILLLLIAKIYIYQRIIEILHVHRYSLVILPKKGPTYKC
ncbi:hypothetical protein SAMN05518847_10244 [Paenibacillus sp. OV219]|nr:hypothetical protein SAMN05518847_10244 [Paenibacillus sp. OV219]